MSVRACVRPRPSWSGPRWWCRPTLKVWQPRPAGVPAPPSGCASRPLCRVVRDSKNTLLATAPADSAETFTVSQRTARYDTVKVAGGGPSVHACPVFFGAESRHGEARRTGIDGTRVGWPTYKTGCKHVQHAPWRHRAASGGGTPASKGSLLPLTGTAGEVIRFRSRTTP